MGAEIVYILEILRHLMTEFFIIWVSLDWDAQC